MTPEQVETMTGLRFLVYVEGATVDAPVAAFKSTGLANLFGIQNYRGNFRIVDRDALTPAASEPDARDARIRALEEAVRVLGGECRAWRDEFGTGGPGWQCRVAGDDGVMYYDMPQADKTDAHPIAGAAVKEPKQ